MFICNVFFTLVGFLMLWNSLNKLAFYFAWSLIFTKAPVPTDLKHGIEYSSCSSGRIVVNSKPPKPTVLHSGYSYNWVSSKNFLALFNLLWLIIISLSPQAFLKPTKVLATQASLGIWRKFFYFSGVFEIESNVN